MNEEERMIDEQKAIEALEELKKRHKVTCEMLIDYIKPPIFTEEIKQRIMGYVKTHPTECTKKQVEDIFNPNSAVNEYVKPEDIHIEMVMSWLDAVGGYSYWDQFTRFFDELVLNEINSWNPRFAYDDFCADAYMECAGRLMAAAYDWLDDEITMDEWKVAFLEVAKEDKTIVDEITESPGS